VEPHNGKHRDGPKTIDVRPIRRGLSFGRMIVMIIVTIRHASPMSHAKSWVGELML
jgi:hypothetical protein